MQELRLDKSVNTKGSLLYINEHSFYIVNKLTLPGAFKVQFMYNIDIPLQFFLSVTRASHWSNSEMFGFPFSFSLFQNQTNFKGFWYFVNQLFLAGTWLDVFYTVESNTRFPYIITRLGFSYNFKYFDKIFCKSNDRFCNRKLFLYIS